MCYEVNYWLESLLPLVNLLKPLFLRLQYEVNNNVHLIELLSRLR